MIVKIIKIHNNHVDGIFKLFTMSLQNIVFYGKRKKIVLKKKLILECLFGVIVWTKNRGFLGT